MTARRILLFCSGGETGRDMSHLEEWREYENLSVSKQLFQGEAILRETNREFTEGGKYKWWFQGRHFTRIIIFPVNWVGTNLAIQVLSTKPTRRAPGPITHLPKIRFFWPGLEQVSQRSPWTRCDLLQDQRTHSRYQCKICLQKLFQRAPVNGLWCDSLHTSLPRTRASQWPGARPCSLFISCRMKDAFELLYISTGCLEKCRTSSASWGAFFQYPQHIALCQ